MSKSEDTFNRKRIRTSYITSVISIAMVLFMLGLLGLLLIDAKKLSDTTRESFQVSIFFQDSTIDDQILLFKKELDSKPYVKSSSFVTRAEAAKDFEKDLGEDFVEFLGYNPLPASIDVRFNVSFTNDAEFQKIEKEWLANPLVAQIDYPRNLINQIVQNIQKLSWFFLAFSLILSFIAITLINNTIRLAIYSKRLLIRTMQLVGATRGFIRWPFIRASIFQGIAGGLIAIALLIFMILLGEHQIPELIKLRDFQLIGILVLFIFLSGIALSLICTFFAVRKYLNLKTDSLY